MSTNIASGRRAWIIAGAVLFQLMVLIAAFSLGVYVERYGFTRDGLSYAGPGGPPGGPGARDGANAPGRADAPGGANAPGPLNPPQGNQPAGVPPEQLPPGLEEPPQLIGRVQHTSPDGLELASPDGPRHVLVDEATVYEDIDGARVPALDLRPGMIVAIYGDFMEGGRNLLAGRVVIMPPPPQQQSPP